MKRTIYSLLTSYCIIFPFYFLSSGGPQISDILLVAAFVLFIFNYRIRKDNIFYMMMIILVLISITNLSWGIVYSSINFLTSIMYYVFNFMLVLMVINLYYYHRTELLKVLYKALFSSVLVQVIISPFLISAGMTRQMLMFNNPNQLGYYALLAFALLTILFYTLKKSITHYLVIMCSIIYLAFLSNSTSTLLAILFTLAIQGIVLFFIRFNMKQRLQFLLLFFGLLVLGFINWDGIAQVEIIENASERFSEKELSSSSNIMNERRYDRVFDYPQFLLVGAGEGLVIERFGGGELHSTIISFLFNYGLITTCLLLILFILLLKKPYLIPIVILVSIHFYGLTHNGIRQPFFWLTNAVIYIGNTEGLLSFRAIATHLKGLIKRKEVNTLASKHL